MFGKLEGLSKSQFPLLGFSPCHFIAPASIWAILLIFEESIAWLKENSKTLSELITKII